jgi:hypothetical protein
MNELFGDLSIRTYVNVEGRERRVTLATIRGVSREECEEKVMEFISTNPNITKGNTFAEWVVREYVRV